MQKVEKQLSKKNEFTKQTISAVSLEFQEAAIDCLLYKTKKALIDFNLNQVVLSGGVAANKQLRKRFNEELGKK